MLHKDTMVQKFTAGLLTLRNIGKHRIILKLQLVKTFLSLVIEWSLSIVFNIELNTKAVVFPDSTNSDYLAVSSFAFSENLGGSS